MEIKNKTLQKKKFSILDIQYFYTYPSHRMNLLPGLLV